MFRPLRSGAAALAVAGLLGIVLTACGTPPWEQPQFSHDASAQRSSAPPTPTPTVTAVHNDLATGATQRQLQAGAIGVTVNYWADHLDQWTPQASKPLHFSLTTTLDGGSTQHVYLSRVTLTLAVSGPKGTLPAPSPLADQSTVSPGYLVSSPYSYSQTFVVPALDAAATSMQVTLEYELLLQTTPTSSDYAKQTATDTLTIALATG